MSIDSPSIKTPLLQPQFEDWSLARVAYSILTTIFVDVWATIGNYISLPLDLSKDQKERLKAKVERTMDGNLAPAIARIRTKMLLGSNVLHKVGGLVDKTDNFRMNSSYLFGSGSCTRPTDERIKTIAIPLVLEGMPMIGTDHIVTVIVDLENKRIEYFNSAGLTINDTGNRVVKFQDQSLVETVRDIAKKMFDDPSKVKVIENKKKAQWDINNCGLYDSDFILRRSKGETAEHIFDNPLSYFDTNQRRLELIDEILA